jgi:uncharacterized protein YecE (DUF72 family)
VTDIKTGCISWTYPDWVDSFYPAKAKSTDFLSLYSRVFNIVEVDSSFYRSPTPSTMKQWKEKTPESFLFTLKMPKRITHELRLVGAQKEFDYFQNVAKILGTKLAAVMVQLPPFLKYSGPTLETLDNFLSSTDPAIRYAIEFRNKSWFNDETYALLRSKRVCFVWSVNEYLEEMPKEVTTNLIYLRFLGEFGKLKKLNKIQIDRSELLREWWNNLSEVLSKIDRAYVLVSNHFAGYAPETVNQFRALAGLEKVNWGSAMQSGTLH